MWFLYGVYSADLTHSISSDCWVKENWWTFGYFQRLLSETDLREVGSQHFLTWDFRKFLHLILNVAWIFFFCYRKVLSVYYEVLTGHSIGHIWTLNFIVEVKLWHFKSPGSWLSFSFPAEVKNTGCNYKTDLKSGFSSVFVCHRLVYSDTDIIFFNHAQKWLKILVVTLCNQVTLGHIFMYIFFK